MPHQKLLESMARVTWRARSDGWAVDLQSWCAYTGMDLDDAQGWGWLEAVHPDDQERTQAVWKAAVARGDQYQVDYRIRDKDGGYRWFAVYGVPVAAEDGDATHQVDDQHELRREALKIKSELVAPVTLPALPFASAPMTLQTVGRAISIGSTARRKQTVPIPIEVLHHNRMTTPRGRFRRGFGLHARLLPQRGQRLTNLIRLTVLAQVSIP